MTMENIEAQIKTLGEGFHAFEKLQKKALDDQSAEVKSQIERVANDVTKSLEEVQAKQGQIEAAVQRVGTGGQGQEDQEKKLKREAFAAFMRAKAEARDLSPEHKKALATDSNPDGGYFVPHETLGIINGRVFETSPMRRIATVISTSNKSIEALLDDQEASFAWGGEADNVPETNTPKVGKLEIVAHKAVAYPKITEELLADAAFDVEAWLAGKVADVISRGENTAFVNGNGVSRPRGFLSYNQGQASNGIYTYARDQLEVVPMGSTSAPTEAGLINLQGSLKEDYQQNAVFAMKRATLVQMMMLAGTNNYRFLNLSAALAPNKQVLGPTINMLDKPVVLMDDMPVMATNSLSVAYGDFSRGYTIVDRVGLAVRADPYTSPGLVKYYTTKRTGGAVTNFEAIKLSKMSVS